MAKRKTKTAESSIYTGERRAGRRYKREWLRWFPDWRVPKKIEDLARRGVLEEHHYDMGSVNPGFVRSITPNRWVYIWINHPNRERRRDDEWYRYQVYEGTTDNRFQLLVDTDDVNRAVKELLARE